MMKKALIVALIACLPLLGGCPLDNLFGGDGTPVKKCDPNTQTC